MTQDIEGGGLDRNAGGFVTSEGVLLGVDTAGPASRLLARALDLVVCGTAFYGLLAAMAFGELPLWVVYSVAVIAGFVSLFVYPVVMETLTLGRTVGKLATGIRVLTDVGGPVGFRNAAVRSALSVVDLIVSAGFIGMVSMILSPRHQRLGDLAAGTVVVRTRRAVAGQGRWTVPTPTGYDSFISSLDTSGLDPQVVDLARTLLERHARQPRSLQRAVDQLARHVDGLLGGRRPERMPGVVFLQCVCVAHAVTPPAPRPLPRPERATGPLTAVGAAGVSSGGPPSGAQ